MLKVGRRTPAGDSLCQRSEAHQFEKKRRVQRAFQYVNSCPKDYFRMYAVFLLALSHLVEGVVEVTPDVELVEENRGLRSMALGGVAERLPHVHDRQLDTAGFPLAEPREREGPAWGHATVSIRAPGQARFIFFSSAVNRGCVRRLLNRNDPLIPYTGPARCS